MSRNWIRALRAASFRGVPFKVEYEDAEGARRLSVSPIAYAETSVIEDMGRDPRMVTLAAYVAGDLADAAARALIGALDAKGPALLVLPMLPSMRARVRSWRFSRERDRAGYVAFDIAFVEEGLASIPFGPTPGAGPIADTMAAGGTIIGAALAEGLRGLTSGRENAETVAAAAAAARLASLAPTVTGGGEPGAAVTAALDALADASADPVGKPAAYAAALVSGWRRVALDADAGSLFAALPAEIAAAGPADAVVGAAERATMGCAMALAAVRRDYPARQDASAARDALRLATDAAMADSAGLGADVHAWLTGITGDAARVLSRTAAARAPLSRVETRVSLSSIRAAYDLYGDANRAGELVDRNRIATPVFMPLAFEALTE